MSEMIFLALDKPVDAKNDYPRLFCAALFDIFDIYVNIFYANLKAHKKEVGESC